MSQKREDKRYADLGISHRLQDVSEKLAAVVCFVCFDAHPELSRAFELRKALISKLAIRTCDRSAAEAVAWYIYFCLLAFASQQ